MDSVKLNDDEYPVSFQLLRQLLVRFPRCLLGARGAFFLTLMWLGLGAGLRFG